MSPETSCINTLHGLLLVESLMLNTK